ncbi:hypothetical protein CULT_960021 [[Clostridium] ultunense Esp]|nr:hypothetical protein CULT_960021 [[Clostridium] ultunense Esp]
MLKESTEWHMLFNGAIQHIFAEYTFSCPDLLGWDEAKIMLIFSGLSEMSSAPARALVKLAQFVCGKPELNQDINGGMSLSELQRRYLNSLSSSRLHLCIRLPRHPVRDDVPAVAESPELLFRL